MAANESNDCYFQNLANETIEYILYDSDINHKDLLHFGLTCKRFLAVVSVDELWKRKVKERWKKWKYSQPDLPWKLIYKHRWIAERFLHTFIKTLSKECYNKADIPASCFKQFSKELEKLDTSSFEAVEEVLYNILHSNKNQNLTIRFYAGKVNRFICHHRLKQIWCSFLCLPEEKQMLEKGAVYIAQWCNFNEVISEEKIFEEFDRMAERVKQVLDEKEEACGDCLDPLVRQERILEAINTVIFHELGFHGNTERYYDINNSYIHKVLERRTGIPITLSLVYLAVARRLGVILDPVNFPTHFILRIRNSGESSKSSHQYVDVFNNGKLLSEEQCKRLLSYHTVRTASENLFPRATAKDVCRRVLANIVNIHRSTTSIDVRSLNDLRTAIELVLLLNPNDDEHVLMLSRIYLHYNINLDEVITNLRQLASPRTGLQAGLLDSLLEHARQQQLENEEETKRRSDPENAEVAYRVGMIMRHRRYHYFCVIYGWDYFCDMNESWKVQMGVYNLSHGADQPFYNVLAHDGSCRYASQENLEPISEARPVPHLEVGRHFCEFNGYYYIPNEYLEIKYPEDHPIPSDCVPTKKYSETDSSKGSQASCEC